MFAGMGPAEGCERRLPSLAACSLTRPPQTCPGTRAEEWCAVEFGRVVGIPWYQAIWRALGGCGGNNCFPGQKFGDLVGEVRLQVVRSWYFGVKLSIEFRYPTT